MLAKHHINCTVPFASVLLAGVHRIPMEIILLVLLLLGFSSTTFATESSAQGANSAEELVIFYPTYGYRQDGRWIIPIRLWVHEEPDLVRRKLATAARHYLADKAGIDNLSESEKRLFVERTKGFIADSESRERVIFVFDQDPEQREYRITNGEGESKTDRNGGLEGSISLSANTAERLLEAQHSDRGWLRFHTVSDNHHGVGYVRLIPPTGLSVISDIDDTIKITGIPEGESVVLRNTFFRDFSAAPCMAQIYRDFGSDTAFHYVSGGPWQMYEPLAEYLFSEQSGFPRGSVHMKNVRTNPFEKESYQDIWRLVANGSQQVTFDQKVSQITGLLTRFPRREFILIGDSGEKDPEVFREIREKFPSRVRRILIRMVTDDAADDPARYAGMTLVPRSVPAHSCDGIINTPVRQAAE
jgi:hypothetical protein